MVKAATKVIVDEQEVELTAEERLINSWNGVVDALENLRVVFEEHKLTYQELRAYIGNLHPKDQRIMHRPIHKFKFLFFLEDISRDARVSLDNLRIGGKS